MRRLVIVAGVTIVVLWVLSATLIMAAVRDWPSRGAFGEMFGAIEALFSGLAFAGVIATVYLQMRELALQRQDLELTRNEMKRAADAQEESRAALLRQVSVMGRTAQLDALNALVRFCVEAIEREGDGARRAELHGRLRQYGDDLARIYEASTREDRATT
jgi:hypothetical protein